jgi:hypothetical protein
VPLAGPDRRSVARVRRDLLLLKKKTAAARVVLSIERLPPGVVIRKPSIVTQFAPFKKMLPELIVAMPRWIARIVIGLVPVPSAVMVKPE